MALRCPREFFYRYVDKIKPPEVFPAARIGKAIHTALEEALKGTDSGEALTIGKAKLEDEHEQDKYDRIGVGVQPFVDRIADFRRRHRVSRQLIEYTAAVREDLTVTQFYSGDAFFRGIFDVGFLFDDDRIAIVDHKTGVRHWWHSTSDQLEAYASLAAASFGGVKQFWLGVHWVADSDVDWSEPVTREQVRQRLFPRVMDNIEAAALAVDDGPRPNTSAWCGNCGYQSICPAAQEARYDPVDDEDPDEDLEG